jgi:cell cycle sensor histidine kinase DivJ
MNSVEVAARDFLDRWVHPDAADEPQAAARHRALIAALLALSMFAVCAFPVWTAIAQQFDISAAAFFGVLAMPLMVAAHLTRTGNINRTEILFAIMLTALAVLLALNGASAPALTLLALVAIEAALVESRRVAAACIGLAAAGLALAFLAPEIELLAGGDLQPLAIGAVGVMAASTAMRIRISRKQLSAVADESEENYRTFADAIGGLVTRHDANGDAIFVSAASRSLLGASPSEIAGGRFVQRVQMSDRVAFLNAMKACVRDRKEATLRLRMLRSRRSVGGRTTLEAAMMEMSCRPVTDDATGGVSAIAVTRDHVEEVRAAEPASDMTALRDPLNAIVEFSTMLDRHPPAPANSNAAPDYARLIRASATQMLDLVNAGEVSVNGAQAIPQMGRPNGQFLPAATKSKEYVPAGRNSGQDRQMKVLFPDFARRPGKARPIRERIGG